MTPEERKQYVEYRIDSAYKTVEAAKFLLIEDSGIQQLTDYIMPYFMRLMHF